MRFRSLHSNFKLPVRSTNQAAAFDIFMPEGGSASEYVAIKVPLGFAAEVPVGHVALLLPRSGVGSRAGLELNNTCGVIDADYRGEWIATLKVKHFPGVKWLAGDRILQFLIIPVLAVVPELVDELSPTERGLGGLGSTGT
jgi:dUTP pyrophosphatase